MPIHLPPLTRRQFLGRALAASAALTLPRFSYGAESAPAVEKWALLSDTHLAADRSTVAHGSNMAKHFETVSREILTLPQTPTGVFVLGDCAFNNGEKGDYMTLTELLNPVRQGGLPIHLALGNHDNRERFWDALATEKAEPKPVSGRQAAMVSSPLANWFILDTLEQTGSSPGLLGHEQLEWLARTLDANPDKPALVMFHHNPGISGNLGLKDTVLLFEILRPRKQVKACFYGHTHVWKVEREATGLHLVNVPAVSYTLAKGVPLGWVQATLETDGMELELRCIDKTDKANGEVRRLKWRV